MKLKQTRLRAGLAAILTLALSSLACQSVAGGTVAPRPTEERLPNPEGLATDAFLSPTAEATKPGATDPQPTQAPAGPGGDGSDFTQPTAIGQTLSVASWDVAVLAYYYGDDALKSLETMSDMVDALPEGRQYVIAQIKATSRFNDNENHAVPYNVTLLADNRHGYFSRGFPMVKEPFSGEVRNGESVTGWLVFQAPSETRNFQIVFSDYDNDFNLVEGYLALTPDAALPPADVASFPADNEIGRDPQSPAKIGDTVITGGFAVTITEILRGKAADEIINAENAFAPSEPEGQEYALARVRVQALGVEPKLQHFTTILFSVQPTTGDPIGLPFLVLPGESVDAALVPGAVLEAWLPLALPVDDDGALLYYDPTFGFGDESPARYFALQP
ncbi:MAG: DUF4352 domain-containing protein [Anaerolineales bacterium]|nr:DUF4352 domain-containing protein [Anaerolineales bacterium]